MVNVSGLQRRSTYEEVAKAAELDEFRDLIKTPDRLPKTILDAIHEHIDVLRRRMSTSST